MTSLALHGIGHLTTNVGEPVSDAVVIVDGGSVTYAGPSADAPEFGERPAIDCGGRAAIPGFVDAHTHLVFAGDRADEFGRRLAGEPYEEIAAAGGGIAATVASTRQADEATLFRLAGSRLDRMSSLGTTSLEIKTGYGLDVHSELKLLRVADALGKSSPVEVRTTFLGAHAVPPEFGDNRDGYVALVIDEMIPAAAGLADYCDVFVERGAFTVDEARAILLAGRQAGMEPRLHAEQLSHTGGAALAAELGAASADHLDFATPEDAERMASAGVTAVLVPGASFSMRHQPAPARMIWDAGCTVALATDCNPGTSYVESMAFVIALGVLDMGLTVEEALWAATRGGAISLGWDDRGLLAQGARADLVVLDAPSPAHIPYRPGTDLVWAVLSGGSPVRGVE